MRPAAAVVALVGAAAMSITACSGDDVASRATVTSGSTRPATGPASTSGESTAGGSTSGESTASGSTSAGSSAPTTLASTAAPVSWPPRPTGCPTFTEAATALDGGPLGTTSESLGEVSGMVASQVDPGLLWVHNDSGDRARLYLVGEDLAIRTTVELRGVFALDWEAMAAGPGPDGRPWLWVADSGDNFLVRPFVELHGIPEPDFGGNPPAAPAAVDVVTLRVRYPGGPADVEAFAVDPRTGDGFLFLKTLDAEGRSDVLRVPAAALRAGGEVEAGPAGSVVVTNGETGARAADISGDGTFLAVKDLTTTSIWLRGPGDDLPALLAAEPLAPCHQELGRGEAIAFSADGGQVWTLEEGVGMPLRRFTTDG